jgi:hypothetical protein
MAVVVGVLASFGWLWLIPALLLEQFLFYMSAFWYSVCTHLRAVVDVVHPELAKDL